MPPQWAGQDCVDWGKLFPSGSPKSEVSAQVRRRDILGGWPQSPHFPPPQRHSLLPKILPSFPSTRRTVGQAEVLSPGPTGRRAQPWEGLPEQSGPTGMELYLWLTGLLAVQR